MTATARKRKTSRKRVRIDSVELCEHPDGPILSVQRYCEAVILFNVTGTAALLLKAFWSLRCPVGVALDRLEEEPSEAVPFRWPTERVVRGDAQDVRDAVLWLRKELGII
jgi:hypothetical protein